MDDGDYVSSVPFTGYEDMDIVRENTNYIDHLFNPAFSFYLFLQDNIRNEQE